MKTLFLYGTSRIERLEVARKLHAHSARARAAFIEAQLTSIPQALRSEHLFGSREVTGWVEQAQGGTLLIDELDCLTTELQKRVADLLLSRDHDVRLMVASRYDHGLLLRDGQLEEPLHHWLEGLTASQRLGPERIKAVRALPDHKGSPGLSSVLEPAMRSYVEAGLEAGGCMLHAQVVGAVEKPLISMVLHHTGGNQLRAASLLGVNRNTLRKRIRDLGISLPKGG